MGSTPRVAEFDAELVVVDHAPAADGVITLTLADDSANALPSWTPGAHIDLILDTGVVRQYSLCSSPHDTNAWRVGVLRAPQGRGGSQFVHDKITRGSRVRVRGPRNNFPLIPAERYQFIAGGIGVTPILPMIESVHAAGAEWHLLYGGRQRDSMAFLDQLADFGDRVEIWPENERGLLDLAALLAQPRSDTAVYCCGPESLLAAVENACRTWPTGSLHVERFAPKPRIEESMDRGPAQIEVVCKRSDITVVVDDGRTILEALEEARVDVMGSCLEGTCGTCEAIVLEGIPDHRDSVLTDDERAVNDRMFPCVSRSLTQRLVLDL